jgi:hypothetical protein
MKYIFIISLILSPTFAIAADFVFTPRVTAGIMDYKWEEGNGTGLNADIDIDGSISDLLPFLGVGTTLSFGRMFIDGYLQDTLDGEDSSSGTADEMMKPYTINAMASPSFDRQDYSISVGYSISSNWAAFAGYKKSKQTFEIPTTPHVIITPEDQVTHSLTGLEFGGNFEYKTKGPFIGVSYGRSIGKKGRLSANFAISHLNVDLESHYFLTGKGINKQIVSSNSGNATGMVLGVKWQAPIVGNLRYNVSLNGYKYDFNVLEERVISLQATLLYSWY